MDKTIQTLTILLVLLLLPTWSLALDGNEILAQVDKNMQPASYEMYRKLINVEPDGSKKEFADKVFTLNYLSKIDELR